MEYKDLNFKIPIESKTYKEDSKSVIENINSILEDRIKANNYKHKFKNGTPLRKYKQDCWSYD